MKKKSFYFLLFIFFAIVVLINLGFIYIFYHLDLFAVNHKEIYKHLIGLDIFTNVLFFSIFFLIVFMQRKGQKYLLNIQELSDANKHYCENASAGFLVVDEQMIITNVNPKLCEIFGYEENDLVGKNSEILHIDKEHFQNWRTDIYKKALENHIVVTRYPAQHANGSVIWLDISAALYSKKKHSKKEVLLTVIEVSNEMYSIELLERTNEQLQENLYYFKTLINAAPTPIFVKDQNFCYTECNDAFLDFFRLKKEDILNKQDKDIFELGFANSIEKQDNKVIETLQQQNYTLRHDKKAHTTILEYNIAPVVLEDELKGLIGFCMDITQKEEKETYLNMRIEQEVMKNLEMQKIHYQERMNDTKFTVIGKLAAGITHEINTPLSFIKGNIELSQITLESLQDKEIKESLEQDFASMTEGLKRIEGIVSSMREMSQQSKETKEKVNIFKTISMAAILCHNRAKHVANVYLQNKLFKFDIKINYDEEKFYVFGQQQRLEQVWVVILNNALDELDKHGTFDENIIKISCEEKKNFIIIRFEDTGKGIDENIIDNLFEPFVGNKEYGGIGIGLNIAHKIIEDHNGSITAYNGEKGAVFEIVLPVFNPAV